MEDFTSGLNSAIDIIEQEVIFERLYETVCYLLQAYGYYPNDRSCQRLLKSKLTKKYDNPLLFVTVERNIPIIIISLASLESLSVSNSVDKSILLKQAAAILKEGSNTFVEKISGVSWPATINKLG